MRNHRGGKSKRIRQKFDRRRHSWRCWRIAIYSEAGINAELGEVPSVRIYGEFCLPARWDAATRSSVEMNERDDLPWSEYWRLHQQGRWQSAVGCTPGVPALKDLHDRRFPYSTTAMTDQIRAAAFLRALGKFEQAGRMPDILILDLESDHTNGTRPDSPTPRAMVADNDLALGRVVEGMSKSKFWATRLILAVEDDAQDGVDHVDGHRTIALAAGPFVQRGVVDSNSTRI